MKTFAYDNNGHARAVPRSVHDRGTAAPGRRAERRTAIESLLNRALAVELINRRTREADPAYERIPCGRLGGACADRMGEECAACSGALFIGS